MAYEIEHKFLVKEPPMYPCGVYIAQGYLNLNKERTVRIRVSNDKGFITVKGKSNGPIRPEYEYEIPYRDAVEMLLLCEGSVIEKLRSTHKHKGFIWELDVFLGKNTGLVVAEIELDSVDTAFAVPQWIGEEVTTDWRYSNSNLAQFPYETWKHSLD